jgi:ribonuclease E
VNSSGGAHARNARRLVQAARKQDRRLQAALLAAALAHTPEAEEVLRGARIRLARKPSALARELLRNFPKGRRGRRRRRRGGKDAGEANGAEVDATAAVEGAEGPDDADAPDADEDADAPGADDAEPDAADDDSADSRDDVDDEHSHGDDLDRAA